MLAAPTPARRNGQIGADTESRAAAATAAAPATPPAAAAAAATAAATASGGQADRQRNALSNSQRRRFDLAPDPLPPRQQGQGGAAAAEPHVVGLPHLDRPSKKLVTYLLKREAEGSSSSSK